jgi:hypothetical protein
MAGTIIPGVRNAGVILKGLTAAPAGDSLLYADASKNLLTATIGTGLAFSGGTLSCTVSGGATDHGALTGLSDDDHPQYLLLAGRSGQTTAFGGVASGGTFRFDSTTHATKGNFTFNSTTGGFDANGALMTGNGTASGWLQAAQYYITAQTTIKSPGAGILQVLNAAENAGVRLIIGTNTNSGGIALVKNGLVTEIKLGDSSAYSELKASKFTLSSQQTYTATNVSTDRSYDANATTTDELADVLGTLIADLRTAGLVL